jgi:hypothetical protein
MSAFDLAVSKFDEYNRADPNRELIAGELVAKELVYARRMSERLQAFEPQSTEAVRLAARCQHIGRWQIPRNTFPADRKGYLVWRNKLKDHHAAVASKILTESGYGQDMINKVRFLLLKKELHHNKDTQLLEDVVCLVFIEHYLSDFAEKHDDDKVIDILRKTMKKMTPRAISIAAGLHLPTKISTLITKAAAPQ